MFTKIWKRAAQVAADSRGDVPGWVLITVMTVALVMAIWLVAGDALAKMVADAFSGVTFG